MSQPPFPPIPGHYTRTVAQRSFVGRGPTGRFDVLVEFGEPLRDVAVVGGFDWRCPMRLTVGPDVTERSIVGIDSLQALQLAMRVARGELELIATRPDTLLTYLDQPVDTSRIGWQETLV